MIDWAGLTLFLYILARVSGCIVFNPILGRTGVPGTFRAGMILVLSVFVLTCSGGQIVYVPEGIIDLAVRLMLELALGFVLGTAVSFFFYIPQLGGMLVDTQMGMTMNQIYDPASRANMSTTGTMLNVLMTLLFFTAGGHHTLLRIFLTSQKLVAFGQAALGPDVYNRLLELFVECTLMGVKLCMPIIAAELIAQLGMGILMKVIPQINVFAINIELKVIIGLVLLFLLMAPISEYLLRAEVLMLNSLSELLALSA